MNFFLITFFLIIIYYFINIFIKKENYLPNYNGQKHQKISGLKNIPLTGGIFITLSFLVLFYSYDIFLCSLILSIFSIGFFSDINFLSSPKLRLLLQSFIIIFFVIFLEIQISSTRFLFLDNLLENIYFKYFFSSFCLLILINGSNFIDGLNGLVLGYFSILLLIIFKLNYFYYIELDNILIVNFILILFYLFILNINNKLFLGDSGSYTLAIICGYFLIKVYEGNQEISPYFIVLMLWYPCFENLFSIIRKFNSKTSPARADNNHLHQLIFFYVKKKSD